MTTNENNPQQPETPNPASNAGAKNSRSEPAKKAGTNTPPATATNAGSSAKSPQTAHTPEPNNTLDPLVLAASQFLDGELHTETNHQSAPNSETLPSSIHDSFDPNDPQTAHTLKRLNWVREQVAKPLAAQHQNRETHIAAALARFDELAAQGVFPQLYANTAKAASTPKKAGTNQKASKQIQPPTPINPTQIANTKSPYGPNHIYSNTPIVFGGALELQHVLETALQGRNSVFNSAEEVDKAISISAPTHHQTTVSVPGLAVNTSAEPSAQSTFELSPHQNAPASHNEITKEQPATASGQFTHRSHNQHSNNQNGFVPLSHQESKKTKRRWLMPVGIAAALAAMMFLAFNIFGSSTTEVATDRSSEASSAEYATDSAKAEDASNPDALDKSAENAESSIASDGAIFDSQEALEDSSETNETALKDPRGSRENHDDTTTTQQSPPIVSGEGSAQFDSSAPQFSTQSDDTQQEGTGQYSTQQHGAQDNSSSDGEPVLQAPLQSDSNESSTESYSAEPNPNASPFDAPAPPKPDRETPKTSEKTPAVIQMPTSINKLGLLVDYLRENWHAPTDNFAPQTPSCITQISSYDPDAQPISFIETQSPSLEDYQYWRNDYTKSIYLIDSHCNVIISRAPKG